MLSKEVSGNCGGMGSRWKMGACGEEVLIDVFCQEPFEVEGGPTSQTSTGLKATVPTSCWRQTVSFPVLNPVSLLLDDCSGPWVLSFRCG